MYIVPWYIHWLAEGHSVSCMTESACPLHFLHESHHWPDHYHASLASSPLFHNIKIDLFHCAIYLWWKGRGEEVTLNHLLPCMASYWKVSQPNFHADSVLVIIFRIYPLTNCVKSTLGNDIQVLNFQHGPKWWRQIVFSVLCFQGTWMCLHYFHLLFSHHFSNLSVNCQHVMKNRREWNCLN